MLRKLITSILTTRLTTIIERNHILTCYNFGLRKGKITNDSITILKAIMDNANESKNEHLHALQDIQKAYDTIP